MADLLLGERVKVLAVTLDAIKRVIDGLGSTSAQADRAVASSTTLDAVRTALGQVRSLQGVAATAAIDIRSGLLGLEASLTGVETSLQTSPRTTAAIRIGQAVSSLSEAVGEPIRKLAALRDEIAAPGALADGPARKAAWDRCLEIEFECGRLFADYLDLVSGVALRNAGRDDRLCEIADALVSDFDPFGNTRWDSLTVPASRELRGDPIAGFVRIGFPESSVWTLPLAMVDFASFLIREHRRTADLRTRAAEMLEGIVAGGMAIPDEVLASVADRRWAGIDPALAARQEESPLGRLAAMLLRESLATAIMGPAYAWATLLVRVDPRSGLDLIERIRRDVVVATLGKLVPEGLAADQAQTLAAEWGELLASAGMGPADDLDRAIGPVIEAVAQGSIERVAKLLQREDWGLIDELAEGLHGPDSPREVMDSISEIHRPPDLRLVLNAGWVARLGWPQDDAYRQPTNTEPVSSPLSVAVRDVCLLVIEGQTTAPRSAGPRAGITPPYAGDRS